MFLLCLGKLEKKQWLTQGLTQAESVEEISHQSEVIPGTLEAVPPLERL